MPLLDRRTLTRRIAGTAICCLALMASSEMAFASYGPPPPPPPVPGGFSCVVTSQTVGPAGKLIGPLGLTGLVATIVVRRGTFRRPVQITITQPFATTGACQGGPGIGNAGFRGYRTIGGVGILVQRGGVTLHGFFRKPLIVQLTSASISRSSLIVVWNGRHFVIVRSARVRNGLATVGVDINSDFAVLSRTGLFHSSEAASSSRSLSASTEATMLSAEFMTAAFYRPAGLPPPGLGVRTLRWLHALRSRGSVPAALTSAPRG
jgi:hypothetical protein